MSWTYTTRPDSSNEWYETIVDHPRGYRRTTDNVEVSPDRAKCTFYYTEDENAPAGSDVWNLPFRFTDRGHREIEVLATYGGGDPPPDKPIIKDITS